MTNSDTGNLPDPDARNLRARLEGNRDKPAKLRCQWCMVDLAAGETACPLCGSPGINDEMIVPGASDRNAADHIPVAPQSDDALVEWWNETGDVSVYKSAASENDDLLPVILGLLATAAICVILGVVAGPIALTPVFESSLGVAVEDPNDLRPLGGIIGLLVGAFISAIGLWVAAPRR